MEMTKVLEYIAEQLIKQKHNEIDKKMSDEDKQSFVNSINTLHQHSLHIQRTIL